MKYFAIVALALAGCAGELENPERFADCGPGYVEALFQAKCAGACHAGQMPVAGLDLVQDGLAGRMVGHVSESEACGGKMLIAPEAGDDSEHLLLDKLSDAPSCGGRMPFGGEGLSSAEIECVRRWVGETLGEESP